jgi:hypothetical protein
VNASAAILAIRGARRCETDMIRSRLLPALLAASLALACASGGSGSPTDEDFVGPPTQVRWFIYKTGQTITLVNDSHTNRLELYSELREAAGPKVAGDAEMAALVGYMEEQDFDRYAVDGPAPPSGGPDWFQALELEVDGRARHMLLGTASTREQRATFNGCATALMTLWNLTFQSQAIDNEAGDAIFQQPGTVIREKSR